MSKETKLRDAAYFIWIKNGCPENSEIDCWLEAETIFGCTDECECGDDCTCSPCECGEEKKAPAKKAAAKKAPAEKKAPAKKAAAKK